jgi:hypothetical protein
MTHQHLRNGLSDAEWIQRSLGEARSDPVGMWQMVKAGRNGYGLTGQALEDFVRNFIVSMVAGGADPVVGNRLCSSGWSPTRKHGANPADIADSLIGEWRESGIDPDVDGVWFALPSAWR